MQQKNNIDKKTSLIDELEKNKDDLMNDFEQINTHFKNIGIDMTKFINEYEEFFTLLVWHIKRSKFNVDKFELNSDTLCYLEKFTANNIELDKCFNVYSQYFVDGLLKNINNTLNDILNKCFNSKTIHYLNLYLYSWGFCKIPGEITLSKDEFKSETVIVNNRYDFCHYINK